MKKIYCDFKWKNNLIFGFFDTWSIGDCWLGGEDRSIVGYIVLALVFPFVCVIAIPFTICEFLLSIKIRR